jgi:hypothetical protein
MAMSRYKALFRLVASISRTVVLVANMKNTMKEEKIKP